MIRCLCCVVACLVVPGAIQAQEMYYGGGAVPMQGHHYMGDHSIGSSEPLFQYDDQEPWKHGYLQEMPFYGGYHSFRPYNYKQVFAQSQVAAGWGMPSTMPYSQQFWHRYANQVDLSIGGGVGTMPTPAPVPVEVPPNGMWAPVQQAPVQQQPIYTPIGYQQSGGYGVPVQQTPIQQYLYGR